jgi:hypothetical protein
MTSRSADCFKRLLESQNQQSKSFVSEVRVSGKAQETSHIAAELVTQKGESHAISESLIMSACKIMVDKMLGQEVV